MNAKWGILDGGTVRDTIADILFPGTSTLQTRARYFLFVPWILQIVQRSSSRDKQRLERDLQMQLCNGLLETEGTGQGVIGGRAGAMLRRWPSSIYWVGMAKWGIRRDPGFSRSELVARDSKRTQGGFERALDESIAGAGDENPESAPNNWADLPAPPDRFPERVSFTLTAEESSFLRERVVLAHPWSYLAHVLEIGTGDALRSADFPWDCNASATTVPTTRALLEDARRLSLIHGGAATLYNVMLAEANDDDEERELFGESFRQWVESIGKARSDLDGWDRAAMWARLRIVNPRLHRRTADFVDSWFELAASPSSSGRANRQETRELIRNREWELKGARARLTYAQARERKQGYTSWRRLDFRWGSAKRIALDIIDAAAPNNA